MNFEGFGTIFVYVVVLGFSFGFVLDFGVAGGNSLLSGVYCWFFELCL
jgi:hypothetical protein